MRRGKSCYRRAQVIIASLPTFKSKRFYSFLVIRHDKAHFTKKGNVDNKLQIIKLSYIFSLSRTSQGS